MPLDARYLGCPGPGRSCFSCPFPDCCRPATNPNAEEVEMNAAGRLHEKTKRYEPDRTALRGVRGKYLRWKWHPSVYQEKMTTRKKSKQEIEAELQNLYGKKLRPISCSMENRRRTRLDVVELYFLQHIKEESTPECGSDQD